MSTFSLYPLGNFFRAFYGILRLACNGKNWISLVTNSFELNISYIHMLLKLLSLVVVFVSCSIFSYNYAEPSFKKKTCDSLSMVSPRICISRNDSANFLIPSFTKILLSSHCHDSFLSLSLFRYSKASLSVKSSAFITGLPLSASSIYGSFPSGLFISGSSLSASSISGSFPSGFGLSLSASSI